MSEKKDIQVQQGLPDKLLSLFKECALFSLPHHLDCQVNGVSDGWISFEGGGTIQNDDLNGLMAGGRKSKINGCPTLLLMNT